MSEQVTDSSLPLGTDAPVVAGAAPAALLRPAAARLRDLHPGWMASVMGTAILAVAADANPGNLAALHGVGRGLGTVLAVVAYALGAVLLVAYVVRWVRHTQAAIADLRHPILGGLHATLPGGLLVLAVMTSAIGPRLMPEAAVTATIAVLASLGAVLALVVGVAFGYVLFAGEVAGPSVNGGWFIPPVVAAIVPMALTPLMAHLGPEAARLLLFVGYAFLGLGFVLFLLVLGLLHDRLVLHPVPPALLAPSLWIALGPIGVSVLAPLALARAAQETVGAAGPPLITVSQLVGTALWGFGLWWLALAVALLVRYARTGPIPFHLGWWAFVFPLGAYTVATITLARVWNLPAVDGLAAVLFLALASAWVTVAVRTSLAVRTGRIWLR